MSIHEIEKRLKKNKPLLDFFEKTRRENLANLSNQISVVRKRLNKKRTILTPLAMDFDKVPFTQEHCELQTKALIDTIKSDDPIEFKEKESSKKYNIKQSQIPNRTEMTNTFVSANPYRHYWTYADDLLEILGRQKLATSAISAKATP